MSKHTPGPWSEKFAAVSDSAVVFAISELGEDFPSPVADCNDFDGERPVDECKANARLIAAAPDMLEALLYVETRCVSEAAYPHASIEDRKMRDMVVAAIAKVEARS